MIVDASVAVKWLAEEPGSDQAFALLRAADLGAPTLIFAEVANALWKKRRRGEMIDARFERLEEGLAWTVADRLLAVRAFDMATRLGHPVYDCLYLALAIERDLPLVTADDRFVAAMATTEHGSRVLHLSNWA